MISLLLLLVAVQLPSGDGAIVMLPGIPADPWGSLSQDQKEEMWTYGIEGYQTVMSGWAGYILRGPDGSAAVLQSLCETLAADSLVPDSSLWARTLQLVWNAGDEPGFVVFDGETVLPSSVPVRTSRWFEAGPDTLMLSLPIENTVMLWGGGFSGDFHQAAWRGIGTELIHTGSHAVPVIVSSSLQGSPEDIIELEYISSDMDLWWGSSWAPLLSAADSMVQAETGGVSLPVNSLIWIRGTGGQKMSPWIFVPSPPPPVKAEHMVEPLAGLIAGPSFMPELPESVEIEMPGNAGSHARAACAAALLERITARMALPEGAMCRGVCTADGRVSLVFTGVEWTQSDAEAIVRKALTPIIFTSPESELINNAAVRAGIPVMDQRETVELLASVAGFI
ncbi:hypothetical protein CSA37_07940 [Candidatus Fermentibacteria bacterium]|nr:MAG: hypothetical protein CSA37_07940 [Candidatus Fermentibacteria bacterium]